MARAAAPRPARQRLDVYRRKRDFARTPEPSGRPASEAAGARYVIHLHHAQHRHFDLRLQVGGVLRSWAVPKGPSRDPKLRRLAVEVEDHPLEYGDFEGVIPEGEYGAGRIWIWDEGRWEPEGDARKALAVGRLNFRLHGQRLQGEWSLVRTQLGGRTPQWLLIKRADDHTAPGDVADDTPLRDWRRPGGARPIWLRPSLVAEVEHRGRAGEGLLRQGSLKGLRLDKTPQDLKTPDRVTRLPTPLAGAAPALAPRSEKPAGRVRLTHPERLLFADPPITKQQLAAFYREIAGQLLPGLVRRPLALLRCPDGAHKDCFFQKHATAGFPDAIRRVDLREKIDKRQPYLYVDDIEGVVGLAQMGVLEMHVWGATVDDVEHPDQLVLDLDPHEDVEWKRVVAAARRLRERLERLELQSFVRTSGGKGLHVVLPLDRSAGWDAVKAFAQAIAQSLAEEAPQEFLATASKKQRPGRIFIDYLRNSRGATSIASYSLRARAGAPIATPLSWAELGRLRAGNPFTYANIRQRLARLRQDPWEAYAQLRQGLPRLR